MRNITRKTKETLAPSGKREKPHCPACGERMEYRHKQEYQVEHRLLGHAFVLIEPGLWCPSCARKDNKIVYSDAG